MNRVAIFARWPAAGRVKSRLSPALPATLACDLYRAMLEDTLQAVADSGVRERFLFWADSPRERDAFADPNGVVVRSQQGPGLGERLGQAFDELLAGPEDRAVVVGADCPDLEPTIIREAFDLLESRDVVVGPASDGGYFLIGLRRAAPRLFEGVAWGTGRVLDQSLERAKRSGLATALLGGLADLDTPDDLIRFVARRALISAPAGQRTEAALRAMGLLPPRA
jgi:rSAM/selenodomain-associated transferase 1